MGCRVVQEGWPFLHVGAPKHPPFHAKILSSDRSSLPLSSFKKTTNVRIFPRSCSKSINLNPSFVETMIEKSHTNSGKRKKPGPRARRQYFHRPSIHRIYSFELIFRAWNRLLDCRVVLKGRLTPWLGKKKKGKSNRDSCLTEQFESSSRSKLIELFLTAESTIRGVSRKLSQERVRDTSGVSYLKCRKANGGVSRTPSGGRFK